MLKMKQNLDADVNEIEDHNDEEVPEVEPPKPENSVDLQDSLGEGLLRF